MKTLNNKRILITGACGTIGKQIIKQLIEGDVYSPAEIIGIDNNESALFFDDQYYNDRDNVNYFLGDIRDKEKLLKRSKGADVIFHVAALKHVVMCERSPFEAVQTNILGVQNIISAAFENKIDTVIFTSSDKAVNPTNVMGTSKLMGERLITAANSSASSKNSPVLASTRFGNVLGSNGSVIPIFRKQIMEGGPVTLTDPEMSRFVMSKEQAATLVIDSALCAKGGEVFVTKMPALKISTLAEVMIEELAGNFGHDPANISIEIVGVKPGEKLYEELMSDEETRRSIELNKYFSVLPAFRGMYSDIKYDYKDVENRKVNRSYNSSQENMLTKKELSVFLRDNGLLNDN